MIYVKGEWNFMKIIKKTKSCILAFILGMSSISFGFNHVSATTLNLQEEVNVEENFSAMTNDELNQYIHSIREKDVLFGKTEMMTLSTTPSEVQLAWKAAAQILINNGYVCAGTLLNASANKVTYFTESYGGIFESTIKGTKKYKNFIANAKGKKSYTENITYTSSGNTDLFLSLHKCMMSASGQLINTVAESHEVTVSDTYDFKAELNNDTYNDLFVSLVNDAAWLSTKTGDLSTFPVNIYFLA